jgi:DegV family protein with EDD domain
MANVGIVTDSTNCLPPDLLKEYDIRVAPVAFVYEGKVYRDNQDLTIAEFFEMIKKFKSAPTTSAVGVGEFYQIYSDLVKDTKQIVCITISKALSATFDAAEKAAEMIMDEIPGLEIKVFDSNITQAALGFIVLEAARAARENKSIDDIIAVAEAIKPRVKYFMILDTISPLQRIGRAPDPENPDWLLPVKPILGMVSGTGLVENLNKADSIGEALLKAAEMVKGYADTRKPMHFVLTYPDRTDEIERLKKILVDKYEIAEIYLSQFTPTMLVAAGPMFGVSFYS